MKSAAAKLVMIFGLCALCLVGYGVSRRSSGTPGTEGLPVDRLSGDFAVDVNNPCEVVGFADYYFMAMVDEAAATSYRHKVVVETEDGGKKELSTPYTDYTVTVLRNIKGALPEHEPILITKAGGVSRDGKSVVLYEDDMMLEPGKTYAVAACVQKDGTLLVSGPNSCEAVENPGNGMDFELDEYESYYANEVAYDRERFTCLYGNG